MAIKSSGTLSLRDDIQSELGGGSTNISLRNMSSIAGFSTPDAMSEFYGYSSGVFQLVGSSSRVYSEQGGSGLNGDPFRFQFRMTGDDSATGFARVQYTGNQRYVDLRFSLNSVAFDSDIQIYQMTSPSANTGPRIGSILDSFYDGVMRTCIRGVDMNAGNVFYIRLSISRGDEDTNYIKTIDVEVNSTSNLISEGLYQIAYQSSFVEGQSIRSMYSVFNAALENMVGGYGRLCFFFEPDDSTASSAPQYRQDLQLDAISFGLTGYNNPTDSPNYFGAEVGGKMQTAFYNTNRGTSVSGMQQALNGANWEALTTTTTRARFHRRNRTTPSSGTGRVYPITGTWFYYYEASGDGYDDYYGWLRSTDFVPIDLNFGFFRYVLDMDGRSTVNGQTGYWYVDFRHTI